MNASNETKYLSPDKIQELLEAMDIHFQTYLRARSLTPYIHKSEAVEFSSNQSGGCFLISTAPLYQNCGYSSHIIFDSSQFDTDEKYQQYQDIGHWINQSFLIELKCILDTFITDWNHCPLKDDEYFKLLELCRHLFAHSSYKLDYRPRKGHEHDYEHAYNLYEQMFGHIVKTNTELNLSIDEFVIPFYMKLVELINEKL